MSTTGSTPGGRPLYAIGLITLALGILSSQDGIVKLLSGEYSVWQLILLRSLFAAVFLSVVLGMLRAPSPLRATRLGGQYVRGALLFIAFTGYYIAIATMPLLDAVALFYTAPLIATTMSSILLRERPDIRRWGAIAAGFVGAVIMNRPGSGVLESGAVFALGAAVTYAAAVTYTNRLGRTETGISMGYYTNLSYVAFAGVGLLALEIAGPVAGAGPLMRGWAPPSWIDLGWLAIAGAGIALGFVCIAQAYRSAPVSVVTPFEYTALLWGGVIGYDAFDEIPGPHTLVGAVVIAAAGLYLVRLEALRNG